MINRLQSETAARIQVAPGQPNLGLVLVLFIWYFNHVTDGSEVNGERSVSICGTPETVE